MQPVLVSASHQQTHQTKASEYSKESFQKTSQKNSTMEEDLPCHHSPSNNYSNLRTTRDMTSGDGCSGDTAASKGDLRDGAIVPPRIYVTHTYRDHTQDPAARESEFIMKEYRFPDRLHRLLEDHSGMDEVISWASHGRCFVVRNRKVFVNNILPRVFRQSKMTSFQRQLNIYGFKRVTAGPDKNAYYHELFLRGRSDLCHSMIRNKIKYNGVKASPSPSTEPNFYLMRPSNGIVHDTNNNSNPTADAFVINMPINFGSTEQSRIDKAAHQSKKATPVSEVLCPCEDVFVEADLKASFLIDPTGDFVWNEASTESEILTGASSSGQAQSDVIEQGDGPIFEPMSVEEEGCMQHVDFAVLSHFLGKT